MSDYYGKLFDSSEYGIDEWLNCLRFGILFIIGLLGLVAFLSFRLYNQRPETQYGPQGEMWIPDNGCFIPYRADQQAALDWCRAESNGP